MSSQAGPSNAVAGQTSASTSRSLLAALRGQDPAAWQRLVSLYAPLVYHWCRKMELADQDAADIFQEVFQSVARRIASFHKDGPDDTFRGWLRTITRNKVRDHLRRESRQPHATGGTTAHLRLSQLPDLHDDESLDDPRQIDGNPGMPNRDTVEWPGDLDDRASFQGLFRRALEQIAGHFEERTWQAFWRVVVEGKSAQEVALELSMQPGTVRVAKSRVLHRLRKELGELRE